MKEINKDKDKTSINSNNDVNNIIGCLLILSGVLLSQLAPIYEKNHK